MKKQDIIIGACLLFVVLIAISLPKKPKAPQPGDAAKPSTVPMNPIAQPKMRRAVSVAETSQNREPVYEDEFAIRATKAFKVHKAAKMLFESPARDTVQCRTMISKLAEKGYGVEYLPAVYDAIWHVSCFDPVRNTIFNAAGQVITKDSPELENTRASQKREEMRNFVSGHNSIVLPDPDLCSELLDIRVNTPFIAYTNQNFKFTDRMNEIPKVGESFLTQDDVSDYLGTHPINELEQPKVGD
jgi:hypothetical protein